MRCDTRPVVLLAVGRCCVPGVTSAHIAGQQRETKVAGEGDLHGSSVRR